MGFWPCAPRSMTGICTRVAKESAQVLNPSGDSQIQAITMFDRQNSQVKWYINCGDTGAPDIHCSLGTLPEQKPSLRWASWGSAQTKYSKFDGQISSSSREKDITNPSLLRVLAHSSIGTSTPTTTRETPQMFGGNRIELPQDQCDPKA